MTHARSSWQMRLVQIVVVVAAMSMLITGVWMRIDPESFARWANWPNHVHFLHDAGVFQVGIGMTMLAALRWRDAISVALFGFLLANSLHALNHALDRDGGNPSDWWQLGTFSLFALIGLTVRLRHLRTKAIGS